MGNQKISGFVSSDEEVDTIHVRRLSTTSGNDSKLLRLPDKIVCYICIFLPPDDILSFFLTRKKVKRMCEREGLYREKIKVLENKLFDTTFLSDETLTSKDKYIRIIQILRNRERSEYLWDTKYKDLKLMDLHIPYVSYEIMVFTKENALTKISVNKSIASVHILEVVNEDRENFMSQKAQIDEKIDKKEENFVVKHTERKRLSKLPYRDRDFITERLRGELKRKRDEYIVRIVGLGVKRIKEKKKRLPLSGGFSMVPDSISEENFEFGDDGGGSIISMAIVMERGMGGDLSSYLERDGVPKGYRFLPDNLDLKIRILVRVVRMMKFLHEDLKIMHLDLKAENIVLMKAIGQEEEDFDVNDLKLIDFGLSRKIGRKKGVERRRGRRWGTGLYSRHHLEEPSVKSDIYSFGILTFAILFWIDPSFEIGYVRKKLEKAMEDEKSFLYYYVQRKTMIRRSIISLDLENNEGKAPEKGDEWDVEELFDVKSSTPKFDDEESDEGLYEEKEGEEEEEKDDDEILKKNSWVKKEADGMEEEKKKRLEELRNIILSCITKERNKRPSFNQLEEKFVLLNRKERCEI